MLFSEKQLLESTSSAEAGEEFEGPEKELMHYNDSKMENEINSPTFDDSMSDRGLSPDLR